MYLIPRNKKYFKLYHAPEELQSISGTHLLYDLQGFAILDLEKNERGLKTKLFGQSISAVNSLIYA